MYSGTPDSAWFVRQTDTNKPVVRLSVVPLNPDAVATSAKQRLEESPPERDGREGDRSVLALTTSSCASSVVYCAQLLGCLQAFSLILQL